MPSDYRYDDSDADWNLDRNDDFFDLPVQREFENMAASFGERLNLSILRQVQDTLGVQTLSGSIQFEGGQFAPENLRGVRFTSVEAALIYLFDSGILRFSNVVVMPNGEIGTEVDPESGKRKKRRKRGR